MKKQNSSLTVVDLFAGCGGLSLGLEFAGFTPVFVNELNKDAMSSYLANRSHQLGGQKFNENPDLHINDIYDLDKRKISQLKSNWDVMGINSNPLSGESISLVCGGPPCQGYSGIGHRRNYSVEKAEIPSNSLYKEMARVVEAIQPKIFLFENVKGLLTSKWRKNGTKGEIWNDVKKTFRTIGDSGKKKGYEVRYNLVSAKDYGVPQNRPRVLLIGIRKDVLANAKDLDLKASPECAISCGFLPRASENPSYHHLEHVLGDLIDPIALEFLLSGNYPAGSFGSTKYNMPAKKGTVQEYYRQSKDGKRIAKKGDLLTEHEYSKHSKRVVRKFSHMIEFDGKIPPEFATKKFSQRLLPRKWGDKGPTITATSLPDDYVHYSQPRSLTVREWARLQTFPDWYEFLGKRTTGGIRRAGNPLIGLHEREAPKYTQIGNAVPVGLAQKVGEHLSRILREERS